MTTAQTGLSRALPIDNLDWANTLMLLNIDQVTEKDATETINILLKYRSDIDKAIKEFSTNGSEFAAS